MNSNPMLVVAGLFLIYAISYLLISIYSALYLKFATKKNFEMRKFWVAVSVLSLAWFGATIVSVMFASSAGLLVFAVISTLAIFSSSYLLMKKTFELQGKHKIFYCLFLSVIINPVWYLLFTG